MIDGGRIKEYADDAEITRIYRRQLAACTVGVLAEKCSRRGEDLERLAAPRSWEGLGWALAPR